MKILTEKNIMLFMVTMLILATVIDIWTAVSSPIFSIAESNPIYLMTGSFNLLLFLTVFATGFMIYGLFKSLSLPRIFLFVILGLYLIMMHMGGAYTNIEAEKLYQENPVKTQAAYDKMTTDTKTQFYFVTLGVFIFLPYLISIVAFWLTIQIFNARKPKRDKIVDEICKLTKKLEE